MSEQEPSRREARLERLEAELRQARALVDDLAESQRELRRQVGRLVSLVEERAQGPEAPAAEAPAAAPPAAAVPPPPVRQSWPWRAAKKVLRTSISGLRRVWEGADPGRIPELWLQVQLHDRTAERRLRLVFAAVTEGRGEAELERLRALTAGQTDPDDTGILVWERSAGRCLVQSSSEEGARQVAAATPDEAVAAIAADLVVVVDQGTPALPRTWVETCRWLMACEGLRTARWDLSAGDRSGGVGVTCMEPWLWAPGEGIELDELDRRARVWPNTVVGKLVCAHEGPEHALAVAEPLGPGSAQVLRRLGPYLVSRRVPPGVVHRDLLTPGSMLAGPARTDDRPGVVVVLSSPLHHGLERRVAGLLESLAPTTAVTVIDLVAGGGVLHARRVAALEQLAWRVYRPGPALAEPVWLPLVELLARREQARTLLHVGDGPWFLDCCGALAEALPGVRLVDHPVAGRGPRTPTMDAWVAVTAAAEQQLVEVAGVPAERVHRLEPRAAGAGLEVPSQAAVAAARAELGVADGAVVVTMIADLVPEARPEDLVALGRQLRDRPELVLVLSGDGPLRGTVADLVRLFGLANLRLVSPAADPVALAAASDLVCTTAEKDPSPTGVLAALVGGTPVVVPNTDDLAWLVDAAPAGGRVVGHPGDVAALATAVRELARAGHPHGAVIEAPSLEELAAWYRPILGL